MSSKRFSEKIKGGVIFGRTLCILTDFVKDEFNKSDYD